MKEQLNAIEERRLEDMERTERQNSEAQKKLEQILNRRVGFISWIYDNENPNEMFQGSERRQIDGILEIWEQ